MSRALLTAVAVLGLSACDRPVPRAPPDFRKLAAEAYPDNAQGSMVALDRLWVSLFTQKEWYFVATEADPKSPSIEIVAGDTYLLAYTDLGMLANYSLSRANYPTEEPKLDPEKFSLDLDKKVEDTPPPKKPKPTGPYFTADGVVRSITMTPEQALNYFGTYKGAPVAGVRFNEGAGKGWFGALPAVVDINKMLKGSGKL